MPYNLIWFTEACLSNALRLEEYIQDAEREGDNDLAEFFRKAQADTRKGASRARPYCAPGSRGSPWSKGLPEDQQSCGTVELSNGVCKSPLVGTPGPTGCPSNAAPRV